MIEELRAYPQMKPSGVPWLASRPAHWEVRRNGRLFGPRRETGFPNLPILEVSIRSGVRVRDFENGRKQEIVDRSKYQRAVRGDVAYNMMRMWQGAVGVAPTDGLVSPAYVVARPLPEIHAAYYAYLFRTAAYMREIETFSRGIVPDRNRLYWESFKQMPALYPPLDEQRLIVRFINWHGFRVAKLIRAKKRLIALLSEQKLSIIHGAVTRGLDPNAKLKPSRVTWLGEIPDSWEVVSIGAVSRLIQTGPFGSQLPASLYSRGGVPVVNPSHLVAQAISPEIDVAVSEETARRLNRHRFSVGDLAIARRGELGRCAVIEEREAGWICGTGTIRLSLLDHRLEPRFCALLLGDPLVRSDLKIASIGATMDNLNERMIAKLQLPVPPSHAQHSIIKLATRTAAATNKAMQAVESEIAMIQEFHSRLIADLVTGKLDARTSAASLPDAVEVEAIDELTDLDEAIDETDAEEAAA